MNFLIFPSSRFSSRNLRSVSKFSSEPHTFRARSSTWSCKYNFISPQRGLCGFFRIIYFSGGSLLSKSQSFKRYSFFASVLVISVCFSSLSLKYKINIQDFILRVTLTDKKSRFLLARVANWIIELLK